MISDDLSLSVIPSAKGGEATNLDGGDPVSALVPDTIVAQALRKMETAKTPIEAWRSQAREADRFETSKQYSDEDRELLERFKRPSAALNTAQKFIRVISGLERRSQENLEFIPSEPENLNSAKYGEIVTKVYNWVLQQCDGNEERSDMFHDKLVRGMGWGEVRLDTGNDPAGMIISERVNGYEMLWDTNARKANITDRTWDARVRRIPYSTAIKRWPDKKAAFDVMRGMGGPGSSNPQQVAMLNWEVSMAQITGKSDKGDVLGGQGQKDMIPVIDFEWCDEEPGYYFFDPVDQSDQWLSDDEFTRYQQRLAKLGLAEITDYTRQLKKIYQRFLFTGHFRITDPIKLPGDRFIRNCMTGSWDEDDQLWYGFMRLIMDPQRYLNAFWNQALELMRVQAKAGLLAETGAFTNARAAEETYSKTGTITWLKEGGLNKIKEKSLPQMPAASAQMMQIANQMLQEVTGVSPDILGLSGGDAPGVTMRQRQLANIALLASEFSALKRFRRDEALTILDFIKYISDGRLLRVVGQFDGQPEVIKLTHEPSSLKYNVLVEENDHDPNVKSRYRESIMQLAPVLTRQNMFLPELLDYMDLPRRIIESLKQAMQRASQQQMQMAAMGIRPGRGPSKSLQENKARVTKLDADTALQLAKAEKIKADIHHNKVGLVVDALIAQRRNEIEQDKANSAAVEGGPLLTPQTVVGNR